MKKNQTFSIHLLLSISVFLVFAISCKKDDDSGNNSTNGKSNAVFNSSLFYGAVTDQEGNVYKTITIGTQTWMAENLRATKYNDGTSIPNVNNNSDWSNLSTGAYCSYNNQTTIEPIATYGYLYNWYTVNTGNLAPKGWHVATNNEWAILISYLGGIYSGYKLKEKGTTHWDLNDDATNESGFTALSIGHRTQTGEFSDLESIYWSSTSLSSDYAKSRGLYDLTNQIYNDITDKRYGLSVRCIKD